MKGNTLFVIFNDESKNILKSYHKKKLITIGWDYEWIINGEQSILDEIASKLKETHNWSSFHTIVDGKIIWHGEI